MTAKKKASKKAAAAGKATGKKKAAEKTTKKKAVGKKKVAKKEPTKKKAPEKKTAGTTSAKTKVETIRIQQVQSPIGRPRAQREALRSLGLRRIRHVVERPDSPAVRGVVAKIPHLVKVVEDE